MKNGNLAKRVKELIKRNGLSQEELTENSGLSLRTIQRIEKGLTTGSSHTIKTLAATLHIESENLIVADINQNEAVADELDKVKLMNQTGSKQLALTAEEARNLHSDIYVLLANLAETQETSVSEPVNSISVDGGGF